MENNNKQPQTHQKKTNEEPKEFKVKFYMYHFPNGQNALMLPLSGNCIDVEIEHVYPPKDFQNSEVTE